MDFNLKILKTLYLELLNNFDNIYTFEKYLSISKKSIMKNLLF